MCHQQKVSFLSLFIFSHSRKKTIIFPLGSIYGGTEVTISGDGFIPADTRILVGSVEYTSNATITYSEIKFITQTSLLADIDQSIPITILVGTNTAVCLSEICSFTWAEEVTPHLDSVDPSSITGSQSITLTGRNFNPIGTTSTINTHVTINGQICNVTSVSNSTISCDISGMQAGLYPISAFIDGMFKFLKDNANIS